MRARLQVTAALLIALIGCKPAAVEAISFNFKSGDQSDKPPGWGSKSLDPFFTLPSGDFWVGTLSRIVSAVSLEFGDYGPSDTDSPVFLKAWSGPGGTGSLLDSDTGTWDGTDSFPDFGSLSVSGGGIQRITFGSLASGEFPNSLFWDNISVPEPASLLLLGAGLAALAWRRMRRP